jgi:Flp pilus assembly pilin Flp
MSHLTIYRFTAQFTARHFAALAQRLSRNESGQDIVEYAGMLAIIALIIGLIFALHLETTISNALKSAVDSIVSGKGSTAGSGPSGS